MKIGRRIKFSLAFSAIAALAAWGAPALLAATGDTDDSISPASTAFTARSSSVTVSATVSGITVTATCTASSISGKTPASGLTKFTISPPTFQNCTDNVGGTDTVTTSGTWKLKFHDAANDETAEAPGDKLMLTIPLAGATLTSTAAPGCVITLAPTKAATVSASYDDVSTAKFSKAKVPFSTSSGCPGGAQTGTGQLTGKYVSSPGFHDVS
jgi:hypothetical protein